MPAESNDEPRRAATGAFIGAVIWMTLLMVGVASAVAAGSIDSTVGAILIGVAAAVTPVTLMIAWRMSDPGPGRAQYQQMRELIEAVQTLTQEGGLSEGAKRVLHRRQERELLRRAIEQDVADEDWDAAMVLVKELAERFGYRADAEEFRARVERARAQTLDRHVIDALGALDEHIRHRRWPEAYAEAARITRLYPESHRVEGLRERVDDARSRYRKDLERRFLIAAEREQVDEAMDLLKELDVYLTPTEAAPYQELARGVIGKLRENLGVRFKLAVQDHLWGEAIIIGEKIVSEFPNTRMAQEVRELMPNLREKADGRARAGAR